MIWDLEEWVCAFLADGIVSEQEHEAEIEKLRREKEDLERKIDELTKLDS